VAATRWPSPYRAESLTHSSLPPAAHSLLATLGRVLAFVLLYGVLYVALGGLLGGPLTWAVAQTGQRISMAELLALVAALCTTALMIRSVDRRPWRDLGLGREAARARRIGAGWLIGSAAIGFACALLLALGWLRIVPSTPGSSLAAAVRITILLLIAALSEEVLCRGYLLSAIRDSIGKRGAIAVTSVVFGLLHMMNPGATWETVLIVAVAGVFLAMVRFVFDSLYAAWAAHAAWNWVMAVPLHAPVSGARFEAPDYRAVSAGPEWISGGAWGPEGGLAAALGMVAAMAYLYARRRREES
jgi:membrane protease YdiL (CAAX protease family)